MNRRISTIDFGSTVWGFKKVENCDKIPKSKSLNLNQKYPEIITSFISDIAVTKIGKTVTNFRCASTKIGNIHNSATSNIQDWASDPVQAVTHPPASILAFVYNYIWTLMWEFQPIFHQSTTFI